MKKFIIPTCPVFCFIGAALLYFGHQRSDPEELNGASKNTLQIENQPQKESSVPESTQKTGKGDTAAEIEAKKEGSNSEKTNDTGGNTTLDDKKKQKQKLQQLPSAEDVAASAAFEAYAKSEIEHKSALSKFTEALKSGDSASLEAATRTLKNARLSREEALRNLASYSEEAAEILAADMARAAEAEKEFDRITAEDQKRSVERRKQIWLEGFKRLSPEQQRTLLDKLPELRELLRAD
ncbi:hypothetical protein J4G08_09810 [Candidatus Poribacteria bacterium]|nr:hypothetical protein [Candidatus Poribacteria bacterium]